MARRISKETPLAEITLRKYEKPPTNISKRDLSRKICLSLGLLQPGDSRDVVVDVLQVILEDAKNDRGLTSTEIEELATKNRKKHDLPDKGTAPSNIRRQILRLRDFFLVEKIGNFYRINEGSLFKHIFAEKIERYYLHSILTRVKEYVEKVDEVFLKEDV